MQESLNINITGAGAVCAREKLKPRASRITTRKTPVCVCLYENWTRDSFFHLFCTSSSFNLQIYKESRKKCVILCEKREQKSSHSRNLPVFKWILLTWPWPFDAFCVYIVRCILLCLHFEFAWKCFYYSLLCHGNLFELRYCGWFFFLSV